jgi:hypothetical protein
MARRAVPNRQVVRRSKPILTRLTALWRAIPLAAAIGAASCIFPVDKGRPIEFVNQTNQNLVLYDHGRQYPTARHDLPAGTRYRNVWLDPGRSALEERKDFRVEALDVTGAVIFCHDYTMKEFTEANWVVVIAERNDCASD